MAQTRFALPILSRELFEMTARRRTFIQRTLFAAIFLGLVYWSQVKQLGRVGSGIFDVLGSGQWLFEDLVSWQFLAVLIVMPLITCGAIVHEKQRDTLTLLLTTQTTPFGIIIQKLISRVCLMLTLLLVSLPLAAFAYSMGGVEFGAILSSVVVLTVTTFMIGAMAIMWSVICSSAVGAFVATVLCGGFIAVPGLCVLEGASFGAADVIILPVASTLPCMFFIAIASDRLRDSAVRPPKNHMLLLFRALDRFFQDANRLTGGVQLIRSSSTLPEDAAITWRETEKKALGQVHHLVRVVLLLELPTVLVLVVTLYGETGTSGVRLTPLIVLLWVVSVSLILVRTSGVIAAERTRQTLDVMLTTPLTGAEILKQYLSGTRRLVVAVCVPFLTICLSRLVVRGANSTELLYVVGACLTLAVYLPLVAWLSMLIGLRARGQLQALLVTVFVLSAWVLLPDVCMSPWVVIESLERLGVDRLNPDFDFQDILRFASVMFAHLAILGGVRWRCLAVADRRLGRCEQRRGAPLSREVRTLG